MTCSSIRCLSDLVISRVVHHFYTSALCLRTTRRLVLSKVGVACCFVLLLLNIACMLSCHFSLGTSLVICGSLVSALVFEAVIAFSTSGKHFLLAEGCPGIPFRRWRAPNPSALTT